jgi:hypothetical protein
MDIISNLGMQPFGMDGIAAHDRIGRRSMFAQKRQFSGSDDLQLLFFSGTNAGQLALARCQGQQRRRNTVLMPLTRKAMSAAANENILVDELRGVDDAILESLRNIDETRAETE